MKRRNFCQWIGAGGAFSMLGCYPDAEHRQEVSPPGKSSTQVATTTAEARDAGIVVVVENGRAVQVEGNPNHPLSRGGISARSQSVLQGLYSPHRITQPRDRQSKNLSWQQSLSILKDRIHGSQKGGVAVLTNSLSDTAYTWWSTFLARIGGGRLIQHQSFPESAFLLASEKVFNQHGIPMIRLKGADCLLSFGARFLETWGNPVLQAYDYAGIKAHRNGRLASHIQVSPSCSRTGAIADRWIDCPPGTETLLVLALLRSIASESSYLTEDERSLCQTLTAPFSPQELAAHFGLSDSKLAFLIDALKRAEKPVVLPAEMHQLGYYPAQHYTAVLLLNKALGAIGRFFNFHQSKPHTRIPSHSAVANLFQDIRSKRISTLLIHGLDPAYLLPPDLGFSSLRSHVEFVVLMSDCVNATVPYADLVIPIRHDLEKWDERLSYLGVNTLQQPVVTPPKGVPQAENLLFNLANPQNAPIQESFLPFLKRSWFSRFDVPGGDETVFWDQVCQSGGLFSPTVPGEDLPISPNLSADYFAEIEWFAPHELSLSIHESERLGDGRFSDRSWLHETPHPMTGIVWDAWVDVDQRTAAQKNIHTGDVVRIRKDKKSITLPAVVSSFLTQSHVAISTGYGTHGFTDPYRFGANAMTLVEKHLSDAASFVTGPVAVHLEKTGENHRFVVTSFDLQASAPESNPRFYPLPKADPIFQRISKEEITKRSNDTSFQKANEVPLFKADQGWLFLVDLDKCTGCGSCVLACQARHQLPAVGKVQCVHGRSSAWLTILRHGGSPSGGSNQAATGFMPMFCQHCQQAPCTQHCPTHAAHQSKNGTNRTDIERCVGFRGCISACPYSVRTFGWFHTEHDVFRKLNPQGADLKPGVAGNCTMCLDQSSGLKSQTHQPACQKACPSDALIFVDLKSDLSTALLEEWNLRGYRCLSKTFDTHPRVVYLKKIQSKQ